MNKKTSKWAALAAVPLLLAVSDRADAALTLSDGSTVAILNPAGTSGTPVKPGTKVALLDPQPIVYRGSVEVELNTALKGAVIYYTLDGSPPGPENPKAVRYTKPIVLKQTAQIRARAYHEGRPPSVEMRETYIVE